MGRGWLGAIDQVWFCKKVGGHAGWLMSYDAWIETIDAFAREENILHSLNSSN